jgi:hypothetical protein
MVPKWIDKRISAKDKIELIIQGEIQVVKSDAQISQNGGAFVCTESGLYIMAKSIIQSGFTIFEFWDEILKISEVGINVKIFKALLSLKIRNTQIILNTTKSGAHQFAELFYSKKEVIPEEDKEFIRFTDDSQIIRSIDQVKRLFDDGIISKSEYEKKRKQLIRRL